MRSDRTSHDCREAKSGMGMGARVGGRVARGGGDGGCGTLFGAGWWGRGGGPAVPAVSRATGDRDAESGGAAVDGGDAAGCGVGERGAGVGCGGDGGNRDGLREILL